MAKSDFSKLLDELLTEGAKRPKSREDWELVRKASEDYSTKLVNKVLEDLNLEAESLADTLHSHYNLNVEPELCKAIMMRRIVKLLSRDIL